MNDFLYKLVYFIDLNKNYYKKISKFQSTCPSQLMGQICQIFNFEKKNDCFQLNYLFIHQMDLTNRLNG